MTLSSTTNLFVLNNSFITFKIKHSKTIKVPDLNRKRIIKKKDFIDNLTDKQINYIGNENLSRSELEIELDKFFEHKSILTDSNKNDVEKTCANEKKNNNLNI